MAIVGAVAFSEFFLLTLYLQDVLHYSAVESGLAFTGFAFTVVVASNVAQLIVSRVGVRPTLTAGLLASALSVAWLTRLPVDGSYFWDLFPAFGGAVGIAAVSAIAATSTSTFANAHGVASTSGLALDHGFQTGLYALTGLLLLGAVIAFTLVRSAPARLASPAVDAEAALREAA